MRMKGSRFSSEVRERAVRLVKESQASHTSEWAAIESVAEKIGCGSETLRKWVRGSERAAVGQSEATTVDGARVRALERENLELRRANEILRKAAAFFAQAELDRRPK